MPDRVYPAFFVAHAAPVMDLPTVAAEVARRFVSWSRLPAWGPRTFERVKVVVRARGPQIAMGLAMPHRRQGRWKILILVRPQDGLADTLSTLLHEMAHVADWRHANDTHGAAWRNVYASAAVDATGDALLGCLLRGGWIARGNTGTVDLEVTEALRRWLVTPRRDRGARGVG